MTEFTRDYKIEDRGAGLCAVFNLKTPLVFNSQTLQYDQYDNEYHATTAAYNEDALLERIKNVEGGGKSASLEKKALFDLQRQKQIKQKL